MSDHKDPIVITGAARTPMGGFQGDLSPVTAPELGGAAITAAVKRSGIAPEEVDEVIMGNVIGAGLNGLDLAENIARKNAPRRSPELTVAMTSSR